MSLLSLFKDEDIYQDPGPVRSCPDDTTLTPMARMYVTLQDDALSDHAKHVECTAQNTNFSSRKQLHSGRQLDMPLYLSMCFSVPGTEYTAPDYQSFAQGIILVIEKKYC